MFGKNETRKDLEIFAIYDSKVNSYREPAYAINKFDVIRQIENMFRDPQQRSNPLVLNPSDYSLYYLGDYDKGTGTITVQKKIVIAHLHEIQASLKIEQKDGAL